jgi:hypothetical protein
VVIVVVVGAEEMRLCVVVERLGLVVVVERMLCVVVKRMRLCVVEEELGLQLRLRLSILRLSTVRMAEVASESRLRQRTNGGR